MRKPDLRDLLAAAQTRIQGARALLARPRTCNPDECITLFREAQGYMEWLRDRLAQASPVSSDLRAQAVELAAEIRQAGVLLAQAAHYGRRWLERLRSISPEYTASGDHLPQPIRGRISYLG